MQENITTKTQTKPFFNEEKTSTSLDTKLNYRVVVDILDKNGFIKRTANGGIILTEKGKAHRMRGFQIKTVL